MDVVYPLAISKAFMPFEPLIKLVRKGDLEIIISDVVDWYAFSSFSKTVLKSPLFLSIMPILVDDLEGREFK